MVRTFITADMHFNHSNIIRYCQRPYVDVADMNNCLVDTWNKTVSKEDTVYHVGDFCFRRWHDNGYQGVNYWESKLNGNIILLAGNHDSYLSVKELVIHHNGNDILIRHHPPLSRDDFPDNVHIVLCGHVHDKWIARHISESILINVGVDMWNFKPTELSDVFDYIEENWN